MMNSDLSKLRDNDILEEIARRFEEKNASILETEQMTKNLLVLNEKIKQTEAIKGEFLSIIKDEFNNPLATLLNLSSMLYQKRESADFEQMANTIHGELLKLDFHFKNIFAATEIEAGEIANSYTTIDFNLLFEESQKSLLYVIKDKNLTLKLENNLEEKIVSDYQKLQLILSNLISNACEYSYPNTEVRLCVYAKEDAFIMEVHDQGEGINPFYQVGIFDRFHKYSSGRTRAHSGLGLGLSVALGMCEVLGGHITFDTQSGDTSFKVSIPKESEEIVAFKNANASATLFDDFSGGVEL